MHGAPRNMKWQTLRNRYRQLKKHAEAAPLLAKMKEAAGGWVAGRVGGVGGWRRLVAADGGH